MSAWTDVVNAKGDDDWLQTCGLAMREIQRVTLQRAAEKIRREARQELGTSAEELLILDRAADLIDPDKQ